MISIKVNSFEQISCNIYPVVIDAFEEYQLVLFLVVLYIHLWMFVIIILYTLQVPKGGNDGTEGSL